MFSISLVFYIFSQRIRKKYLLPPWEKKHDNLLAGPYRKGINPHHNHVQIHEPSFPTFQDLFRASQTDKHGIHKTTC